MKNKTTNIIAFISVIIAGITLLIPTPTYADYDQEVCDSNTATHQQRVEAECYSICSNPNVSESVKEAAGCNETTQQHNAETIIINIISAIIGILGIVAVIFIVVGGVQYMTSTGDATKLKKAKDTILYACIGLAIAALAFAITNFAIHAINGSV